MRVRGECTWDQLRIAPGEREESAPLVGDVGETGAVRPNTKKFVEIMEHRLDENDARARQYSATIVAIHGEVDPVSQSVQVVAEMQDYHEELLPGMSGHATFDPSAIKAEPNRGFLGLVLNGNETDSHGHNKIK